MNPTKRKTALITGVSGGIDYELATLFARDGIDRILVARQKDKLTTIKLDFEQRYLVSVHCLGMDLALSDAPDQLYQFCQTNHLRPPADYCWRSPPSSCAKSSQALDDLIQHRDQPVHSLHNPYSLIFHLIFDLIMVKFTILLRKREELSHDEFVAYHKTRHAPLFSSLPEVQQYVRRYVQCHTLAVALPGMPPPAYDGITELWFDNEAAIGHVFTSDRYMALIRPDEAKFLDLAGCSFLVCTENPVM